VVVLIRSAYRSRGARSSTVASSHNGLGDASINAPCKRRTVSAAEIARPVRSSDTNPSRPTSFPSFRSPLGDAVAVEQQPLTVTHAASVRRERLLILEQPERIRPYAGELLRGPASCSSSGGG
jgi:hypothetical protein